MRHSFFNDYSAQITSVRDNIIYITREFADNGAIGNCGFCLVFVCRKSVYDFVEIYDPAKYEDLHLTVFKLKRVPIERVVNSRLNLLKDAIAVSNTKEWDEVFDAIYKYYSLGENGIKFTLDIMEIINNLSHHGYRSLFSFISELRLSNNMDILERLFNKQPRTGLLLYILNSMRKYSHNNEHFPNMFLNDAQKWREDAKVVEAYKPHVHTYWLKYFMLKYIEKYREVRLDQILEEFCTLGKYEEHLVRLVLGSLCTSNSYCCAMVKYELAGINKANNVICISDRGKTLVNKVASTTFINPENEFCFTFSYLQLVVEDYLLAYPKDFINDLIVPDDYSYLYYPKEKYGQFAKNMITKKAKAVGILYLILHTSLDAEMTHRDCFYNKIKLFCPDMKSVGNNLYKEINALLKYFSQQPIQFMSDEDIERINRLKTFFEEYYRSGVQIKP
ncbi:MAG: hypothetical protein FJ264_11585 [Planctomycetes bacterium]|nr:hypothetical protein [Planctomycetota bacterium]